MSLFSDLAWELTVLSRAIAYQNLSSAATHVGLSQPQLSRIVAKLESSFGVALLDRASKRHSGWTPLALRIGTVFQNSARNLENTLLDLVDETRPRHLNVGTLEGLTPLACAFAKHAFEKAGIPLIELNVYDLNRLEELFLKGELHMIFTSREPGRRKLSFSRILGYQSVETLKKPGNISRVMSSFEYGIHQSKDKGEDKNLLVSNSLALRKLWFESYGGSATMPTVVRRARTGKTEENSVYLIASELFPPKLWQQLQVFPLPVTSSAAAF